MIRNVVILTLNDLAIAFKNKTLYLILFIPLFVFVSLELVDGNEPDVQTIKIGLLEKGSYPAWMVQTLQSADRMFAVSWLPNEEAGKQWLKDKNGDGILVPFGKATQGGALIVLEGTSFQSPAAV